MKIRQTLVGLVAGLVLGATALVPAQVIIGGGGGSGGGGGATVASPDTSIQFNNNGDLGGSANLTWAVVDGVTGIQAGTPYASFSADMQSSYLDFAPNVFKANSADVYGLVGVNESSIDTGDFYASVGAVSRTNTMASSDNIYAGYFAATSNGSADAGHVWGSRGVGTNNSTATLTSAGGFDAQVATLNGGNITSGWGYRYTNVFSIGGGVLTNEFAFYSLALGGGATNTYSFWSDEQGVFRIRADNTFDSVYQAIPALYNPQFTKYTPGAANYERVILGQWNGNVAEIGTEVGAGGGNVLRNLRFIGANLQLSADTILENGKALEGDTTSGHSYLFNVYDTNTGPAYVTWATITNGNTPSVAIAAPAGGTTLTISGLDLTTAVAPAASGTRYLCISTTGVVTSSAAPCVGT